MALGINATIRTKYKEQMLNVSRVFGKFSTAQLKKMQKLGMNPGLSTLAQMFVDVKTDKEGSNKPVEVQQANPALNVYDASYHDDMKKIFNGAGYTYLTGEEQAPTNASTLFSKGKDIETTKAKRSMRQRDYEHFIRKLMVVAGMTDADKM